MIRLFPVQDQVKGYMAVLIVSDIVRAVIKITGRAVRHDIAGEPSVYLGIIFDIPVDDKRAVVRQECGDTAYMTYDDTVYHVVVQVTNTQDGGLSYQVFAWTDEDSEDKAQELAFLNTYAPPPPTPTPDEHPDIAEGIENGTWGGTPTPKPVSTLPQTSDALPLTALVVVLVLAAAAIVVLVVLRVRKNKQDGQQ